jgi:membrane protease YdiL (CAAX protease family)
MPEIDLLRLSLTGVLALLGAWALDGLTARKGLLPPGFHEPWRRGAALFVVALFFWIGVTGPLAAIGQPAAAELDLTGLSTPQLFLLHILMVATLLSWFVLGFAGVRLAPVPRLADRPPEPAPAAGWNAEEAVFPYEPPAPGLEPPAEPVPLSPTELPARLPAELSLARQLATQFGFVAPTLPQELGLGLLLGVGAWVVVLVGIMLIGLLLLALGADEALPKQPPALIPFIAGLPIWVKILISLSAGVVEEWFFRGFLQPRMGLLLATLLFALAHFSYGQPFMLIGVTLLSLIYGLLVKWRQNIWPAIAAHALFDAVQLLVVVPGALRLIETEGDKAAAFLGFC